MRNVLLVSLLFIVVTVFSGCSTIKGLGEDVAAVGGWITKGSDHVKEHVGKERE